MKPDNNKNDTFEICFKHLLQIEGGYVNDSADSGGATRYGITEAVARKNGYNGAMAALPLTIAKTIYKANYWDTLRLSEVANEKLQAELFDSAVNVGTKRATLWLQRALNVLSNNGRRWDELVVDGIMGGKTIAVIKIVSSDALWMSTLVKALNCLQGCFYIELAEKRTKDKKFLLGWLRQRVTIT